MLTSLEQWLDVHAGEGFAPVRDAWRSMSDTLGREVRASISGEEVIGTAEDIDEVGALLVRTGAGLRRVLSGDIELLRTR